MLNALNIKKSKKAIRFDSLEKMANKFENSVQTRYLLIHSSVISHIDVSDSRGNDTKLKVHTYRKKHLKPFAHIFQNSEGIVRKEAEWYMTIHLFLNKVSFTILSVPSDSSAPIRLRERKKKRAKRISKKVKGLTVSASQKQIKTDAVVRVS